ncbi:MAG: 50S ribosomal protein L32 [Saprospiraceae bacterium]|nr:50S ribosomal protein L32 [Saprospiraceae bacterium]
MAHPKSRISKQRKRKRRTHYKAETPHVVICRSCGNPVQRHRICDACGSYRGRTIINKAEDIEVEDIDNTIDDVKVED